MSDEHRLEGLEHGAAPGSGAGLIVGLAGALFIVIAALGGTLAFTGTAAAATAGATEPTGGLAFGGVVLLFCAMLGLTAFFWRAVGDRIEGARQPARIRSHRQR
jgi:hypothetical protein